MKAETTLLPTEPATHLGHYHWREWLCCQNYTLTNEELHVFYVLKQQANILFQGKNQRWDLIKSLYSQYFGEPVQVHGKQWMRLGFQGQYPESDFRGGGVLALQLIIRFVKRNREMVQQMEKDKGGFFFAITAINIAFFMKKYFHLADFLVPERDKDVYCDRRALKNFCQILATDEDFYVNMHQLFLRQFYVKKWVQAHKLHPQTLMQFNRIFQQFQNQVRNVFENYSIHNWRQFQTIFHHG